MKGSMPDVETISSRKGLQVQRKSIDARNFRTVQQDRDNRDVALKCSSNFDTNKIIWVVETAFTCLVSQIEPSRPDNREKRITLSHLSPELLNKIGPKGNAINIHKDVSGPKLR